MESKESPILQGLNPAQRDAVVNYDSPSLIIAGAGSGKTRVLTSRIAYMIEQGIKPWNILALTFTNKAAESMRERIAQMLPDNRSRYIRMGTFHSVFSRILRENAEKIGFPESFTIYEPSDCKNLIKTIVRELNLPDEKYKPNLIASRISYAKNCLVTPGAYLANSVYAAEDRQAQIPEFGNVYNIYCQRCKRNGAMDFDDLLLNVNILFRDFPDALEKYQNQFYSFDYGDVHFVVLNTQSQELADFEPSLNDDEVAWFKEDMAKTTKKWKIVLMHKDPLQYGFANRPEPREEGFSPEGRLWMPLFDQYGVDAVLSAHLHTYRDRGHIRNFQRDESGPLYLITGVAGNVQYPGLWKQHSLDEYVAPQPETDNYMTLEATDDSLTFRSFLPDGQLLEEKSISSHK